MGGRGGGGTGLRMLLATFAYCVCQVALSVLIVAALCCVRSMAGRFALCALAPGPIWYQVWKLGHKFSWKKKKKIEQPCTARLNCSYSIQCWSPTLGPPKQQSQSCNFACVDVQGTRLGKYYYMLNANLLRPVLAPANPPAQPRLWLLFFTGLLTRRHVLSKSTNHTMLADCRTV